MQIGPHATPLSRIAQAHPDRVEVRGRDLRGELMGRLSFTEYFYLLLTGREPTTERYFLDLLLVAIAEHGMMPTNVAARMTLAARAARILELADERGVTGRHIELARCLREAVAKVWGKHLTMNVSMPIAALLLDLGFAPATVKTIPILARTAGLLAQLTEEQQQPIGFLMAARAEEAIDYEPPPEGGG